MNYSECPDHGSKYPEASYAEFFREMIEKSLQAAHAHLQLEIDRRSDLPSGFRAIGAQKKGKIMECGIDSSFSEMEHALIPGQEVRIISQRTSQYISEADDREVEYGSREYYRRRYDPNYREPRPLKTTSPKQETSVVDAVVKNIIPPKEEPTEHYRPYPSASFELKSKGDISFRTAKVELVDRGTDRKFLALLKEHEENPDSTALMHQFITGEFRRPSGSTALETRDNLNESQNRAYGLAMEYGLNPVLFLHGGPGTGKTRTLCEIVKGHLEKQRKVLVLSHSNSGINVPAVKLKDEKIIVSQGLDGKKKQQKVKVHIAGNKPDKIDKKLHGSRIKRRTYFPKEALSNMNGMSDQELMDMYRGEPVEVYNEREVVSAKSDLRESILHQFKVEEDQATEVFMKSMRDGGVAFSTLGTLLSDKTLPLVDFDVVIIDEATKMRHHELLLALRYAGTQVILVGDPKQLGPVPLDRESKKRLVDSLNENSDEVDGFGFPVFEFFHKTRDGVFHILSPEDAERATTVFDEGPYYQAIKNSSDPERDLPYVFLDEGRRSLPNITHVVSELFYDGKLKACRTAENGEGEGDIRFIDTSALKSKEKLVGTSHKNKVEAEKIAEDVLEKVIRDGLSPEDIGVIAMYNSQSHAILRSLKSRLWGTERGRQLYEALKSNVASVDSFQGDERRAVFISLTRSNDEGEVGFLDEKRRLNVALSRGQDIVHVYGDKSTVVDNNNVPESRKLFGCMVDLIEKHGAVIPLDSNEGKKHRKRKRGHGSGVVRKKRKH